MSLFTKNLSIDENLNITGEIMDDTFVREELEKRQTKHYGFFRTIWGVIYVSYWQTIGYLHDPDYSTKIRDIMKIKKGI